MIVIGGYSNNNKILEEILSLDLKTNFWIKLTPKDPIPIVAHGACVSV